MGGVVAQPVPWHESPHTLTVTAPPSGAWSSAARTRDEPTPLGAGRRARTAGGQPATRCGPLGDQRCSFVVWAPSASEVAVVVEGGKTVALFPAAHGYFAGVAEHCPPGLAIATCSTAPPSRTRRRARSPTVWPVPPRWSSPGVRVRYQRLRGGPLAESVLYELHVGTFTAGGTSTRPSTSSTRSSSSGSPPSRRCPSPSSPARATGGYDGCSLRRPALLRRPRGVFPASSTPATVAASPSCSMSSTTTSDPRERC